MTFSPTAYACIPGMITDILDKDPGLI